MRRKLSLAVFSTILFSFISLAVVSADNWPQWRGPVLNGTSSEKNLPVKWTTEDNVTWKLEMPGWSGSTPIIWGETIFLNASEGESNKTVKGNLYLWCVDRAKGTPLWKKLLGAGDVKLRKQNMSSPSPVTDGKNVWVLTG